MDLLDFEGGELYFDQPPSAEITRLLAMASASYGSGCSEGGIEEAESLLLRAFFLAPENLTVLVAVYRFYYYRHRYPDAFLVAERALEASGKCLGLPNAWQELTEECIREVAERGAMPAMRFYLLALKGAGFLQLRMNQIEEGKVYLAKVAELDQEDRLGAKALLEVAEAATTGEVEALAAAGNA